MRRLALLVLIAFGTLAEYPALAASALEQSQAAHARGACGSLGPGTGLVNGKGWVVSMLPGQHDFRMTRGGEVHLTAARASSWDFDAGRPYYVAVEGASSTSVLEWKVPGKSAWAPVPVTFLYPPSGVTYGR